MRVLCVKWLHITLQGLVLPPSLPSGIKLESTDNPSSVVHTTPSTLSTFHTKYCKLHSLCILHAEHLLKKTAQNFFQQCMIVVLIIKYVLSVLQYLCIYCVCELRTICLDQTALFAVFAVYLVCIYVYLLCVHLQYLLLFAVFAVVIVCIYLCAFIVHSSCIC